MGLVRDNFTSDDVMKLLPGGIGIGHVRYSTAGNKGQQTAIRDVQPFFGEFAMGGAAIAHNGNITNAQRMYRPPDGALHGPQHPRPDGRSPA